MTSLEAPLVILPAIRVNVKIQVSWTDRSPVWPEVRAGSLHRVTVVAADTVVVLAGVAFVLGVVVLVLLVWAPWSSVRNEPPLPDDVETRLLLGEDPEQIAADEDAAEARARRATVVDLSVDDSDEDDDVAP